MADSRSLTFDELEMTSENGSSDLNVEFLRIADSSESAFMAYEQILRNRGRLTDADAVYFVIPEPIRLLGQWAEKYKERYRWRLRGSFTCTNPFGAELRSVAESLNRIAPGQFAFTGAAAASLRAPFVDIDKIDQDYFRRFGLSSYEKTSASPRS
jgi:hypothetical protein